MIIVDRVDYMKFVIMLWLLYNICINEYQRIINMIYKYEDIVKLEDNERIPLKETFELPILYSAEQKITWSRKDLIQYTLEHISGIPTIFLVKQANYYNSVSQDKHIQAKKENDPETLIKCLLSLEISNLKNNLGFLNEPKNHMLEITSRGKRHFDQLSNELKEYKKTNSNNEKIQTYFSNETDNVKEMLLNLIININPYEFEKLTVDLLIKIGYLQSFGHSQVTAKTNDDGIDAVIYEDPLEIKKIYIQAKKYNQNNHVSIKDIKEFAASIDNDKGIFMTTSNFSDEAKSFANSNKQITLIDGTYLINLLLKYKVGVRVKKTYELLEIDEGYFNNFEGK